MRLLLPLIILSTYSLMAQDKLAFYEISKAPEEVSSGNIIGRMIDGLGYRYYWASKDLRPADLDYRPSEEASSTRETLEHIYGLASIILNAATTSPNNYPKEKIPSSYLELRKATLEVLHQASQIFYGKGNQEVAEMRLIFTRAGKQSDFPVWNLLNGPLADAIYHTGQIVSFRRTSGNPIDKGVNVFLGKTKP